MTDKDRRVPSNQEVINAVTDAVDRYENHIHEYHFLTRRQVDLKIEEHERLMSNASENNAILKRMEAQLISVIETVHGEAEMNIDGVVERSGGLEDRVDNLEKESKTERLRPADRVALYTAAIGAVTAIVVMIVSVV